jgi:two-component system response regulator ResD
MGDRVLVVEDDGPIRDLVRYHLVRAGYAVDTLADGEQALHHLFASRPDVLILDLMLPGRSGLEVLREVRGESSTRDLPVIVLTARTAEMDRLLGFEAGADDYLGKPFSPRELVARVSALLRRSRPDRDRGVLEVGALRIDLLAREATCAGRHLDLSHRQFDVLAFMAGRPGRALTREELLRQAWGYDFEGDVRVVDVLVRRLRMRLGDERTLLETVPGSGYRLAAAPRARELNPAP